MAAEGEFSHVLVQTSHGENMHRIAECVHCSFKSRGIPLLAFHVNSLTANLRSRDCACLEFFFFLRQSGIKFIVGRSSADKLNIPSSCGLKHRALDTKASIVLIDATVAIGASKSKFCGRAGVASENQYRPQVSSMNPVIYQSLREAQ